MKQPIIIIQHGIDEIKIGRSTSSMYSVPKELFLRKEPITDPELILKLSIEESQYVEFEEVKKLIP